ncbi:MAG: glycosyltransferase [Bacteroidales bacterium]|jgi:GT2 family glycosyltransferase|nr:glycosyltransferase [Bacteroidales bacterium]MCI1784704.1 glycosyltransferase [Bacteroidales bacterium]
MLSVALLMTVHHRKEKTLSFLSECFRQIDALSADGKYSFVFYLNDDGSTDGLYADVQERFPQVVIIRTDGDKYWCGGLRTVWEEAAKEDFDFYLWLDYDLELSENAFSVLLYNSAFLKDRAIVAGSVTDGNGKLIYGGRTRYGKLIEPDPVIPTPCSIMDGNLVLIPKSVFSVLGSVDDRYQQYLWDYDYGIRAVKSDVSRVIAPGILACCERHRALPVWRNPKYSVACRYKAVMSPKGLPFKQVFLYDMRNFGLLRAVARFIELNCKVLFPKRW